MGSSACILFPIGDAGPISRSCGWQIHHRACKQHRSSLCIQTPQPGLPRSTQYRRVGSLDLITHRQSHLEASPNSSQPAIDQERIDLSLASSEISISSPARDFRPECRFRSFPSSTQHTTPPCLGGKSISSNNEASNPPEYTTTALWHTAGTQRPILPPSA
jgi:hypothetical protein